MSHAQSFFTRALAAYGRLIVRRAGTVLATLLVLAAGSAYLMSRLTIEPNQLDLISQELPEVKEVKRVIDMVGGAGYLMLALRANDEATLKKTADAINEQLAADKEHVRFLTYKVPVEFIQDTMVLFLKTEDLAEGKKRINAYLKDQLRRNNPFFIEIRKTEPVKLELQDLIDKYSKIGQKSIRDDYYISDDRQMMLMLIKPMWNSTELPKTAAFVSKLNQDLPALGQKLGIKLVEDYDLMGDTKTVAYGFTGSYKTALDDSYAIEASLEPVTFLALGLIALITVLFFRRWLPTLIVISGTVLGTVVAMGFTKLTLGELNMITSMIAALLMGFGVDFGIHFMFRTRIELGAGKGFEEAVHDAVVNAGRPALVAAVVTGGSFAALMVSEFRGFSQFGFLAAFGTVIIGVVIFTWSACVVTLLGRWRPELPAKLIGTMKPVRTDPGQNELRIPKPKLVFGISTLVVVIGCVYAIPWTDAEPPAGSKPGIFERAKYGTRFDYNTRSLLPDDQTSVKLQDEVNRRFQISSDPIAVYSKTLEEAKEVYDELTQHPEKYSAVAQVVSIYTFVPPPQTAEANAKILTEWEEELKEVDVTSLPPEVQDKAARFKKMLATRPFGVDGVPAYYQQMFQHLPTTRPENHGWLTFIYPSIDLWDGKQMLRFADQVHTIKTASGKEFHGAGLPILYAVLARIVLADGKLMVLLAGLFILIMHYLDFRSVKLAAASVIPLGVGLLMTLGFMSIADLRLNFMNIIILPILLGFGVSHGLYLLHRFLEGTSPLVALRSVGAAVAASTLTTVSGFAALLIASHNGLRSVGVVACIGLTTMLVVSFTVLAAVLQIIHDQRRAKAASPTTPEQRTAA